MISEQSNQWNISMMKLANLFYSLCILILLPMYSCRSGNIIRSGAGAAEQKSGSEITVMEDGDENANIPVRTESFSFELPQDRAVHDPNRYFIIIGSFRFSSNANAFKDKASEKGLSPFVLVSERGYHRIAAFSYSDEIQARTGVQIIRTKFPEYSDVWLLIRK